jgi:hypothetical protein
MHSDDYFWIIIEHKRHKTHCERHPKSPKLNNKKIIKKTNKDSTEDIEE